MATAVDITHRLRAQAVTQVQVARLGHDRFREISAHIPRTTACECVTCGALWPDARYRSFADWVMRHQPPKGAA